MKRVCIGHSLSAFEPSQVHKWHVREAGEGHRATESKHCKWTLQRLVRLRDGKAFSTQGTPYSLQIYLRDTNH